MGEDVGESDDDGGEEEVQEGVDPNPNAKDDKKDKDTTTVPEDKKVDAKATATPAVKLEAKKDEKKVDAAAPVDKKAIQIDDVKYEEIPASHASAAYGDNYTRVVPPQYREMRDD